MTKRFFRLGGLILLGAVISALFLSERTSVACSAQGLCDRFIDAARWRWPAVIPLTALGASCVVFAETHFSGRDNS